MNIKYSQYLEAERRYKESRTDEEKVTALKEMYALLPKHKGTDKIRADLRRRISQIRKKEADLRTPFTLPEGSTVMDFAVQVHKDFAVKFESARIWGSGKFPGQTVAKDHVLKDGDVLELHLRD